MSSTALEPSLTQPATLPSVSVVPTPASSSGLSFGSGPELPPSTPTSSESLPTSESSPMSSPTQSGSPSLPNPTPSPSQLSPSVPPSSTDPPMSSATTPPATSQPPDTSQLPSPTTSDPPSTSPPPTSVPPSATSQPPSSPETPSTSPEATSQPTSSQLPSTTSTPPETTTEPPDTSTTPRPTGRSSSLVPVSTFPSTVFVTTTDQHGSTTLSAPSAFTSTLTDSFGEPITVTQIISNPTLIPDGGRGSASAFFQNKGAVAGVFVVVGLAATAVVLSIMFWFRRRRKTRMLDQDTAVEATLAEHGYKRQNLIDAEDDQPVNDPRITSTPSGSGSSAYSRRVSTPSVTLGGPNTGPVSVGGYDWQPYNPPHLAGNLGQTYTPYTDNHASYQNANPGQSNPGGMPSFSLPSVSGVGLPFFGHGPQESVGSFEPLLGVTSGNDTPPGHPTPAIPPRNPLRLLGDTGNGHGDGDGRGDGIISKDENGGYEDDDAEYEALNKRSLKVRNNPC